MSEAQGPDRSLHPVVFGDDDPEDAWDAADPLETKVSLLRRWVASLEDAIASGDYEPGRELHRKLLAREAISVLIRERSTPDLIRTELATLDERLDDVEP